MNCAQDHLRQVVLGTVPSTIPGHRSEHSHYTNESDQVGESWPGLVETASVGDIQNSELEKS